MTQNELKTRIHSVLKNGYFKDPGDLVDISDGPDGNIHLVIISRKFDGRRTKEKHDLIWSELSGKLSPEEWGQITLSIGMKSRRDQESVLTFSTQVTLITPISWNLPGPYEPH